MAGRGNFQVGSLVLRQRRGAGSMQGADRTQATTYECYDVGVIKTPHGRMIDRLWKSQILDLSIRLGRIIVAGISIFPA